MPIIAKYILTRELSKNQGGLFRGSLVKSLRGRLTYLAFFFSDRLLRRRSLRSLLLQYAQCIIPDGQSGTPHRHIGNPEHVKQLGRGKQSIKYTNLSDCTGERDRDDELDRELTG